MCVCFSRAVACLLQVRLAMLSAVSVSAVLVGQADNAILVSSLKLVFMYYNYMYLKICFC